MTSLLIDNILNQLYPYLPVSSMTRTQYHYVPMKSLWDFFNKPFGYPVKINVSRNETAIIYFQPLIQRLQIKIDQQIILYEIAPGQDDEIDINAQIQEIQLKYPVIDGLKQSEIRENSYIIIKWISLNLLQNIKIKSKIFGYYALQSLEMDQQIQWFNRNQQEIAFYMRKVYQQRPKTIKFTITPFPSMIQKEEPQTTLLLQKLSKREDQFSIPNYFYKDSSGEVVQSERLDVNVKQEYQGYSGFNKFILSREKEINQLALLTLHNYITNYIDNQQLQNTLEFWINILGYQQSKVSPLYHVTLRQEITRYVDNQMLSQSYDLPIIQFLTNILYYSRVYLQYNEYYGNKNLIYQTKNRQNHNHGKKEKNNNQSITNSILEIVRPFIANTYNNQQRKEDFDSFCIGIDENLVDNAIKLFEVVVLNKFTQQFDDTCKLNITGSLFESDSEEFDIVNSDVFQIVENIRGCNNLKDHILRQKREYSTALYKYNPKLREKILLTQRLHNIKIVVDMKDKQLNEIDKIFFQHYNQYLNELIVNGCQQQNSLEQLSNKNKYKTELIGQTRLTYYEELVKKMYKCIHRSALLKQLQQITDNTILNEIKNEDIRQLTIEYLKYLTDNTESSKKNIIFDNMHNYVEIFQWLVLQKRTQNIIYMSQIGYQISQQDDIIEVDDDELQMNKDVIQGEIGHVYGLESQEIKYIVGGATQPQLTHNASKFKLRDMPSQ